MKRLFPLLLLLLFLAACTTTLISETTYTSYLAVVFKSKPLTIPNAGLVNEDTPGYLFEQYYRGPLYKLTIRWVNIEPLPGYYDWSTVDNQVMYGPFTVVFHTSPTWANGGADICQLPTTDNVNELTNMINAALARYPEIVAFELWNEPDTGNWAPYYLGCLENDYHGGQRYALFYNQVYASVKPLHPNVRIYAGSVMNPENDFFMGMLEGLNTFDGISLHAYNSPTNTRLDDVYNYVKSKTSADLMLSETGVTCTYWTLTCDMAQVEHYNSLPNYNFDYKFWYTGLREERKEWQHTSMFLFSYDENQAATDFIIKSVGKEYLDW